MPERDSGKNTVRRMDIQHTLKFPNVAELNKAVREGLMDICSHSSVDRVLEKINTLHPKDQCHGSLERKGQGAFQTVARRHKDKSCTLKITPTYAGDQRFEIDFSRIVKAPIGYEGCMVERIWTPKRERDEVPFREIEAVYTALGQPFDQKVFESQHNSDRVNIINDDVLEASLKLKRRFMEVFISPVKKPTFNTELEQRIRDLGDAVEVSLTAVLSSKPNNRLTHPAPA